MNLRHAAALAIAALVGAGAVLGVQAALRVDTIRDANYCRRFADEVIANRTDIDDVALAMTLPMRKYFEQACLDPPRNYDEFIDRWLDAKLAMTPPKAK